MPIILPIAYCFLHLAAIPHPMVAVPGQPGPIAGPDQGGKDSQNTTKQNATRYFKLGFGMQVIRN